MLITIVNEAEVPNAELLKVLRAISRQIFHDFEPYWHLSARLRLAVQQPHSESKTPEQKFLQELNPLIGAGAAGAVQQLDAVAGGSLIVLQRWKGGRGESAGIRYCYGFHDMDPQLKFPIGYVFVTYENDRERPAWSVTLSHEILELIANPHVNLLVQGPRPEYLARVGGDDRTEPRQNNVKVTDSTPNEAKSCVYYQREVCDPVKESWYEVDGVKVANFVLPLYFVDGGIGPNGSISSARATRRINPLRPSGFSKTVTFRFSILRPAKRPWAGKWRRTFAT